MVFWTKFEAGMHKAKGLYGGWKITFVVADANNRVTAGIDGVMEMCKGVTFIVVDVNRWR